MIKKNQTKRKTLIKYQDNVKDLKKQDSKDKSLEEKLKRN